MSDHEVYIDVETLRAEVGNPSGPEADAELAYACLSGSRWVDHYIGVNVGDPGSPIETTPVESPLNLTVIPVDVRAHRGALVAAIRHMRSPDVPFSVAGGFGDLAVRVQADIPEAAMVLRGLRESWGVA